MRHCMSGLQGGNDSFQLRQHLKSVERFIVRNGRVLHSSFVVKERVLWSNRRIIEARRDRMGRGNLSALILQDITHRALQNPGTAAPVGIESGRMLAQLAAKSAGFDPN